LFEHIIKGTPLPDKAYRWNENDAVRKVGRTLPSALELIKIGEENGVSFVGVDSKAPAVESVTRLCILHHPVSPDQAVHGVLRGIGPASAPHNSTMNTLTHQESSILSMTQSVGQDSTFPLIMGTTAVVSICPYGFPAGMNENGEEHETYLKIRKESRLFVVEYVKAVTQLFPNLVSVALFGEAYPFYQDNLAMVDASMVDQVRLGLGGIVHPCASRYGTREEHSIVQLKTSGTYYGKILQNDYVFDPNDPKTEMFIRSTPRLMMDEEKHRENTKAGTKAGIANMSDEDKEGRIDKFIATKDNARLDMYHGLKNVDAGGPHSILVHCPKCDIDKQRQTTQTISKEGAGCVNMKKGAKGQPVELYKASEDDQYSELVFTTSSNDRVNVIEDKLKELHPGKFVPGRGAINLQNGSKGIVVRETDRYSDPVDTYYTRKISTEMLYVIPSCTSCKCDMCPVNESHRSDSISILTLHDRKKRGLLPAP